MIFVSGTLPPFAIKTPFGPKNANLLERRWIILLRFSISLWSIQEYDLLKYFRRSIFLQHLDIHFMLFATRRLLRDLRLRRSRIMRLATVWLSPQHQLAPTPSLCSVSSISLNRWASMNALRTDVRKLYIYILIKKGLGLDNDILIFTGLGLDNVCLRHALVLAIHEATMFSFVSRKTKTCSSCPLVE